MEELSNLVLEPGSRHLKSLPILSPAPCKKLEYPHAHGIVTVGISGIVNEDDLRAIIGNRSKKSLSG